MTMNKINLEYVFLSSNHTNLESIHTRQNFTWFFTYKSVEPNLFGNKIMLAEFMTK